MINKRIELSFGGYVEVEVTKSGIRLFVDEGGECPYATLTADEARRVATLLNAAAELSS